MPHCLSFRCPSGSRWAEAGATVSSVPVTAAPPAGAAAGLHTGAPGPTRDGAGAGPGTPRRDGGGFLRRCQARFLVSSPATARAGGGGTEPWGGVCGEMSSVEYKERGKKIKYMCIYIYGEKK